MIAPVLKTSSGPPDIVQCTMYPRNDEKYAVKGAAGAEQAQKAEH